jgi:hypothetical protein
MASSKILTLSLEFELSERRQGNARLRTANDAAVRAAIQAVENELLPESVKSVRNRLTWDYRLIDNYDPFASGGDDDEMEGVDEEEEV